MENEKNHRRLVDYPTCNAELDDEIIGNALSSPLLIQEREEPAENFVASSVLLCVSLKDGRPVFEPSLLNWHQ